MKPPSPPAHYAADVSPQAFPRQPRAAQPPPAPQTLAEQPQALRVRSRIKTGGSGILAIPIYGVGGLFCIAALPLGFGTVFLGLVSLVLGFVCLIVAYLVDSKHRTAHHCTACGNEVAATSSLCPTCRAALTPGPDGWQMHGGKIGIAIIVVVFILAALRAR